MTSPSANDTNDLKNVVTAMSAGFGTELNFVTLYNFNDKVSILASYSNMFAASTIETIRGGHKNAPFNWAFLMIAFQSVLFNSDRFMKKINERTAE